jgi:hypothetical protein
MSKEHDGHIHRTETPDVSHIRNVEVTHERSDVNVSAVVKFVFGLTVMTVAVYILMWGFFRLLNARTQNEAPPGPMAMSEKERLPPEPRLQGAKGFGKDLSTVVGDKESSDPKDPKWEIRVVRQVWEDNLKTGSRDANGKVVGMPIEEAMKKIVEGGLPSRVSGPMKLQDFAISAPTAASSGRTTEKRLQ